MQGARRSTYQISEQYAVSLPVLTCRARTYHVVLIVLFIVAAGFLNSVVIFYGLKATGGEPVIVLWTSKGRICSAGLRAGRN